MNIKAIALAGVAALSAVSAAAPSFAQDYRGGYGPDRRATLRFPSPFLRNEPTHLVVEGGETGTAHSWETVHTVSYEEAFKRELVEFHEAIREGRPPRTDGEDGLRDVLLCQAIARAHATAGAVASPTAEGAPA